MTKPELADSATKCNLTVEETGKIDIEPIGKMLDSNALAIPSSEAVPQQTLKYREVEPVKTSQRVGKLDIVEGKLYCLEPGGQPEKALKLDLDLYQMEDF